MPICKRTRNIVENIVRLENLEKEQKCVWRKSGNNLLSKLMGKTDIKNCIM